VCVCVCERERVCVCERETHIEREREGGREIAKKPQRKAFFSIMASFFKSTIYQTRSVVS